MLHSSLSKRAGRDPTVTPGMTGVWYCLDRSDALSTGGIDRCRQAIGRGLRNRIEVEVLSLDRAIKWQCQNP